MTLNFSETIMRKTVAVLAAGTLTGAVDLLGAFASYSSQGATVDGILKYIAGGLLGPTAMQGGIGTALLGLLFHFALTTGMAGVYMLAAIKIDTLIKHPWISATIYGVITWAVMVYVVVPLSGVVGWKLPTGWSIVSGLLGHIFYVGIPIAHIIKYGLRDLIKPL